MSVWKFLQKRKSLLAAGVRTPNLPARSLVTILTALFWLQ